MHTLLRWSLGAGMLCASAAHLWAGGSGLNVVVVVNQNSTNSVQLGNYYSERRQVPPQNYLRISWPGGNTNWSNADFNTYLLNPLLAMLASRQLTNQIDYVVLSMDLPYRVDQDGSLTVAGTNSTTAALFYGFKPDFPPAANPPSCSLPAASSNSYAGSESIFRLTPPATATTNSFLAMMITSSNLAQAKAIIDQGVAGDGALPQQMVILGKSGDVFRNIRYQTFDNAIFNARLAGVYSMLRTNSDSPNGLTNLLGYQNGLYHFDILPNTFVPGALADSLTSFGGIIFLPNDHTTLLAFLNAGAAGSYGTVVEPCGYLAKFPSAQDYFCQARGFSLAECYYQSVTNPYQGLLVGEPLAAPFAQPASGAWSSLPTNALLSGTTNLSLQFTASDANHPVQQVDLFVDGTFTQTLTNIPPRQNNVLTVTLNGRSMNYTVPAAATIKTVAAGLTSALNNSANTNATKVSAFAHGDRIELQSFDFTKAGPQISLLVSNSIGSASALTTFVRASGTNFLDTIAYGLRGCAVSNAPLIGDYLQLSFTKTNGATVTVAITNVAPGTNTSGLTQGLMDTVNTNAALQGSDGVAAEDLVPYELFGLPYAQFNLRARSAGWNAAELQAGLSGSATFLLQPAGTQKLEENLSDIEPRAHLYITAGAANLPLTFAFNTTTQANGFHELTAVVYEGSHVHTQQRVAQTVQVTNSPLSATFTTLVGDTNTAVEATLQFSVVANTNNVAKIELFSTGGSLESVANQSGATFAVGGTNLGLGPHPFYALITTSTGKQYRTPTRWLRLVGADSPFPVSITTPPPAVSWPAAAGRSYDVLSTINLANGFQLSATLAPSNAAARWTDTNTVVSQRFYRVRTSN